MSWFNRLKNTIRPRSLESDLEEELRHHMDLKARDCERWGMTPGEAREEARRLFGSTLRHKENTRDADISLWLESVLRDLRYAARQLIASPLFTCIAVLTLSIGIGSNTAIYSLLHAVLLKDLSVPEPGRLVLLTDPASAGVNNGSTDGLRALLSYAEFTQLRAGVQVFDAMFASESGTTTVMLAVDGKPAEMLRARMVSGAYFTTLGATPAAGRFFTESEERGPGSMPVAVLSYNLWQNRFGGAAVVGTTVRLQGKPFTIVGVAQRGFQGENAGPQPELWLPMLMQPQLMAGRDWLRDDPARMPEKVMWLHAFGRLKPGFTLAQAQAQTDAVFKSILEADYRGVSAEYREGLMTQHLRLQPGGKGVSEIRPDASRLLTTLLCIAAAVLLIACANLANLMLARSSSRRREIGIRLALGAGRVALIRQMLLESLLLASMGAAGGFVLMLSTRGLLLRMLVANAQNVELGFTLHPSVLLFTSGLLLLTVLLCGLIPAIRGTRAEIGVELKDSGKATAGGKGNLAMTRWLVSAQVGASLLLIIGAGLFLQALEKLRTLNLGYDKERLILLRVDGLSAGVPRAGLHDFFRELNARLVATPGVARVAWSENGLLTGTESADEVVVDGFKGKSGSRWDQLGPDYFSTLGIPLRAGREFTERDFGAAPRICVVNEAFVRKFVPDGKPLGKRVTNVFSDKVQPSFEIVGVAADVVSSNIRRAVQPRYYIPAGQMPDGFPGALYFTVRTRSEPKQLLNTLRQTIQRGYDSVQITRTRTIEDNLQLSTGPERMIARLSAAFGAVALLLAAMGLYGVLAYGVARRANEIGVRMALGARGGVIVGMVLKESAAMVTIGVVAGVAAAVAAARLIGSRFYGVNGLEWPVVAAAIAVLCAVALAAAGIPAWRAARIDPIAALRHD